MDLPFNNKAGKTKDIRGLLVLLWALAGSNK